MRTLFLFLLLATPALLQQHQAAGQIDIHIWHNGEDRVGTKFIFSLREAIQKSTTYKLTESEWDPFQKSFSRIDLSVATIRTSPGDDGISSAVSLVAHAEYEDKACKPQYTVVMHQLIIVGRDRTDTMAAEVLAILDKSLREKREALLRP